MLTQVLSLLGAAMILGAYAAGHHGGLRPDGLAAGLLNLVGGSLVAASAVRPWNAGVFVLEATWAAVSLGVVVRALRRRRTPPSGPPGTS